MFQWYLRVWSYIRLFITYSFIHCWGFQRWLHCHWGAAWVGKAMNTLLPCSQPYKGNPQYGHKHVNWKTYRSTDLSCTLTWEDNMLGISRQSVSGVYIRLSNHNKHWWHKSALLDAPMAAKTCRTKVPFQWTKRPGLMDPCRQFFSLVWFASMALSVPRIKSVCLRTRMQLVESHSLINAGVSLAVTHEQTCFSLGQIGKECQIQPEGCICWTHVM